MTAAGLKNLVERYPAVQEEQIDEVISEFAALLKNAFDSVKGENPGKRIRITLE